MKPIKLIVKTNSEKYPIIIGRNLISNLSQILKKNSISFKKCLLVLDKNIPNRYIKQIGEFLNKFDRYPFDKNWKIISSDKSVFQPHIHHLIVQRYYANDNQSFLKDLKSSLVKPLL